MLNLLIAIMGDTYDRVQEVAKESQLKEICMFIEEFDYLFPEEEFQKAPFTCIVTREASLEKEGNEWDGRIGALKTFMGRLMKTHNDQRNKIQEKQERKIDQLKEKIEKGQDVMKKEVEGVKKEVEEVRKGQEKLAQELSEQMKRIENLLLGKKAMETSNEKKKLSKE